MGRKTRIIEPDHQAFVESQPMWFVATSAPGAHINLSPKGKDTLRILREDRVLWLNLVGSGNETAAHLLEDNRMTLMFCSFGDSPLILRIYGHARSIHPEDPDWSELIDHFGDTRGARQLIDLKVELVHTSCGFGVPRMDLLEQRPTLDQWVERKGEEGLIRYQLDNNVTSLDGRPTGLGLARTPRDQG